MATLALDRYSLCLSDLDSVIVRTRSVWEKLRGRRIFLTGGTGFFGKWLLETFRFANHQFELEAELVVLSREPQRFLDENSHFRGCESIQFHKGDVRDFAYPAGEFSHLIHAATDASAALNQRSPKTMFDVIVEGTRRVLNFSQYCGAERLLLVSSGAFYGKQPAEMMRVAEDYVAKADLVGASAYGDGKRMAEDLCASAASRSSLIVPIARCFAFVGPHLPLDRHFAIGNFLGDALRGGPVVVCGDGKAIRSYMYAADLAAWLWTILVRGESCRPYNVGSDQAISIRAAARSVAELAGCPVEVQGNSEASAASHSNYYVPAIDRARRELGLHIETDFRAAIARSFAWHQESGGYFRY